MKTRVAALVCLCFLLGSTGWLSWLYRITRLAEPTFVDLYTMVFGYIAQAAGIGIFLLVSSKMGKEVASKATLGSFAAYVVLLEPATTSDGLAATLGFGWAMNIFCGFMQACYLERIACCVEKNFRGTVYGGGYALSTAFTWIISVVGGGVLSSGIPCLALCVVLAGLSAILLIMIDRPPEQLNENAESSSESSSSRKKTPSGNLLADRGMPHDGKGGMQEANTDLPSGAAGKDAAKVPILVFAGTAVVLVSLVKNMGFSFPAADLSGIVDLELSRLFYGVGLIIAGIVADRDRRYALACCAASLAMPFLMLALTGAGASGVILWALGYLLFGFFTVFRVTLFADIASETDRVWLAGAGMLFGRLGDALGTVLCMALGPIPFILIMVTAVLFALSMTLLFALNHRLYVQPASEAAAQLPERDVFSEFCIEYGLSAREREVLPLLVSGKTNAEIAERLFVTESTVKYHVRNIRKKTGCNSRLDVADLYTKSSSA